jgi:hypothetical protein
VLVREVGMVLVREVGMVLGVGRRLWASG